jgi:hypothetical protein
MQNEVMDLNKLLFEEVVIEPQNQELPNPLEVVQTVEPIVEATVVINDNKAAEDLLTPSLLDNGSVLEKERLVNLAKRLLGTDTLEIEVNGEIQEVKLEDAELSDDIIADLVEQKIKNEKEDAVKNKIDIKGISDITRTIIDIDKNGGDISKVLETKKAIVDPLSEIDLSTVQGQRQATYMKLKAQGYADKDATILIRSYETSGQLEEIATESYNNLVVMVNNHLEEQRQAAENARLQKKEQIKNFKKEAKERLSIFELKDTIKDKIVTTLTKETSNGRYEIDDLYAQAMSDPSRASKLALFLLDEEEYNNQVSNKKVIDTQLEIGKKLRITRRDNAAEDIEKLHNSRNEKGLLDLDKLI